MAENAKHKAFSNYLHLKKSNYAYVHWDNQVKRRNELENIGGNKIGTSAEIASIIAIQAELGQEVKVHLLSTDTILSVLAAKLIKKWFEDSANKAAYPGVKQISFTRPETSFKNNETEDYVVKDLRIDSNDDYEKGAINLLEVLNRITDKNTILNITGGYKVIVPLLTVWAQIKKVQLKYLFNESELAKDKLMPLTLGEFPLNLDWNVVEALKPILKNYILQRIEPLAFCVNHDDIAFDDKRQMFVSQNEMHKIPELPRTFHQVLHAIALYKLVRITEEKKIDLTALGKVFVNSQLLQEDMIGYEMELVLHKLFLGGLDEIELLKDYCISKKVIDLTRFFKVIDTRNKQIQLCNEENRDKKEIGDMDVALEKEGTLVWVEAKAFQAFCTLKDIIDTKKDYYLQLKARAMAVLDSPNYTGNIEILLLVFRFVFKGLNDESFTASNHFNVVSNYLSSLNNEVELKGKASFRCIGIKVPIIFNSNRIDMTAFYKCKYSNWEFEEIKTIQQQLSESITKIV